MPDQLIRDIPLIQRYSRHNENDDIRFRTFLKWKLEMSNRRLDAIVQEETERVWSQIDCTTCGHCCRTLQVVVDTGDIKKLAARLEMSPAKFAQKYVKTAEDKTRYFAASPCTFLGEDNRCTVYEDRPKACRDFPYLHEKDFRSRTLMMIENTATCPIVFNVWQALKQRLRGRRS